MATKQEMLQIISLIAGHHNLKLTPDQRTDMLRAWGALLKNHNAQTIETAINQHALTNHYPPKPAQILHAIKQPNTPTPEQAWETAKQHIHNINTGTPTQQPHPLILKTLKTAQTEQTFKQTYKKHLQTTLEA